MNSGQILHETVIRDIADVIMSIKDSDEVDSILNRGRSYRSIAQASSNLVMVFPVAASKSISIENLAMVTKAIERKAVSMLQMLFSAISLTNADNAIEYLHQFHTNLKMDNDVSVDYYMDALDKFVINQEAAGMMVITDRELYEQVKQDMKNLSYEVPDTISESSINDYRVLQSNYYGNQTINKAKIVSEDIRTYSTSDDIRDFSNMEKGLKDKSDRIKNQVLDSDIKKANELIPTTMIINFVSTAGEEPIPVSNVVVGVKAKLYPMDSMDIINRVKLKNQDNNGLNKFVRATTREISFFKDLLFAIDKAKIDALSTSRKGSSSKMWKVLERRSLKSRVRRGLGQVNDATAITTLVISQEEVEYLRRNENIDLEKVQVARPIMEAYNLMGMSIVDESVETVKFLFDTGDDIYETLPFRSLEREASDNSYKKIINLMTKIAN